MMGARVGMVKTPLVYCTAVKSAPTTKKSWAGSTIRVRRTVASICSGVKRGNRSPMMTGASTTPIATSAVIATAMGRMMAVRAAQPPSSSSSAR
jgi:hypothetical protein